MKLLLDEQQLREGVARVAREIQEHYEGRPVTLVAVLTGSMVFVADLIRHLNLEMRVGVILARSYRGRVTEPGQLVVHRDMLPDLRGSEVLVVDDIFDSGSTLFDVLSCLDELQPHSIRTCVLLKKKGERKTPLSIDHVAFEIPDEFVVGYGLDYNDHFRHLPYLAALEPHDTREEPLA